MAKTLLELFQQTSDASENGIDITKIRLKQEVESFFRANPEVEVVSSGYSSGVYHRGDMMKPDILHTFYILYKET